MSNVHEAKLNTAIEAEAAGIALHRFAKYLAQNTAPPNPRIIRLLEIHGDEYLSIASSLRMVESRRDEKRENAITHGLPA